MSKGAVPQCGGERERADHLQPSRIRMWRGLILICAVGAILTALHPVNRKLLNIALLSWIGLIWFGCLMLAWERKPFLIGVCLVPVVAVIPFCLPAGRIDGVEGRLPAAHDAVRGHYLCVGRRELIGNRLLGPSATCSSRCASGLRCQTCEWDGFPLLH
jgi:hypothetical protein